MAWTNEQQAAIDSRGQTLLLSAAAGLEAEKDADPYYHCSSTADRTEFYTGKGNFADDSFPDPIPGYRL